MKIVYEILAVGCILLMVAATAAHDQSTFACCALAGVIFALLAAGRRPANVNSSAKMHR
jgi:hypothetical protein